MQTRPDSLHDLFNALAWLAFPRTKARINAMHAAEIPREGGKRGRLRDLLTILDEGGAMVCAPPPLAALVRDFRWKELFWERREETLRSMKVHVLGHAILEQALEPRPGITCKVIFAPARRGRHRPGRARRGLAARAAAARHAARHAAAADLRLSRLVRRAAPARSSTTMSGISGPAGAIKSQRESARQPLSPRKRGWRKVRAPQSGMQGNSLARRRDE